MVQQGTDGEVPPWRPSALHVVACLVLVSAGAAVWAVGRVSLDDAFITYRYAQHLAQGHGPVFNLGERVEGYTNPLWVLFSSVAIRGGIDPYAATAALGVASYLACVAMAQLTSLRVAARDGEAGGTTDFWKSIGVILVVSVLVASRDVPRLAGAGLETYFVSACLLAMGIAFHWVIPPSRIVTWCGSVCAVAAVLTRPDAALGIAASAVASIAERPRGLVRTLASRYSLATIGTIALTIWRVSYYGTLLPNSYYAKAADQWHITAGLMYVAGYVANSPYVVVLLALAGAGLVRAWHGAWRGWQIFLCTFTVLHLLYVVKVGGDFMSYRFMFEALPLLVCAAGVGIALIRVSDPRVLAGVGAVCLALSFSPRYLERSYAMQSLWEMDSFVKVGREAGLRLKKVVPSDTIIATSLAGTVPYYSGLTTIDEFGLNDRFIAHEPSPERFVRGHVKHSSVDYLVERGVNLIVEFPIVCSCARPCELPGVPQVFIRLSGDRCLRTGYLVQKTTLTDHFCAQPREFVLRNVACP
jgi:hypothetical protein